MGAKLGNCLTALGLCSMAFYAAMMVSGAMPVQLMPQFFVSSIIFLTSGRIMRRAARAMVREDAEEEKKRRELRRTASPADWPWLTGLLNWTAALLMIGTMALFLMKPLGVSLHDVFDYSIAHEQFFAGAVP